MSRIANSPVPVPQGVDVTINESEISVKGSKGSLTLAMHQAVSVAHEDGQLLLKAAKQTQQAVALAGTFRSLINNMVVGVTDGFQKQLEL